MKYTNSPLATYINVTKNKTINRNHKIDTITPHCYVGQITAKEGCDYFATTDRECSSNYIVGHDGSVALSVDEKDRSWCSSSPVNDHRAVTIEIASEKQAPYAITDAAYNATIQLIADICKRNGIRELIWSDDKSNRVAHKNGCNITVHRDFDNTECPGDYLYSRLSNIAAKVNEILDACYRVRVVTINLPQLERGIEGYTEQVRTLQQLLINKGYGCGMVNADGVFGEKTEKAVKYFQAKNGIGQDGKCGPKTWGKLLPEM